MNYVTRSAVPVWRNATIVDRDIVDGAFGPFTLPINGQ